MNENTPVRHRRSRAVLLSACASIGIASAAVGAARTWDNTVITGNWNLGTNWVSTGVPQAGEDIVMFQTDAANRVVTYVNPSGVAINSLQIDSTGPGVFTLVQPGDDLAVTGNMDLGRDGRGAFHLQGGSFTSGGTYAGVHGTGTFQQSGGDSAFTNFLSLGEEFDGFGHASVTGSTSTMVAGEIDVGYNGTGTFVHTGGSVQATQFLSCGVQVGARGTYILAPGGSLFSSQQYIGLLGDGTFVQTGGDNYAPTVLSIGENTGAAGTYTIGNAATLYAAELDVGFEGLGVMNQNGGSVTTNGLYVATRTLSAGTYNMTAGSLSTGEVSVGADSGSHGKFFQTGGSHVVDASLALAYYAGSRGEYELSGGTLSAGSLVVGGSDLGPGGLATFSINGGNLNVSGLMKVWGRSLVRYDNGVHHSGSLDIDGGRMLVGAGAGVVVHTNAIAISNAGVLDLTSNRMIVDYPSAGPSPMGLPTTAGSVAGNVALAYENGDWTASAGGITSSMGNSTVLGVGYAEASQALGLTGSGTAVWGGRVVDASSVLVRLTYYGDATLDGFVNSPDFNLLGTYFGTGGRTWYEGDFNYDGFVNSADFNLLATNFAKPQFTGPMGGGPGAGVPEPGAIALLGAAWVIASRRRRA